MIQDFARVLREKIREDLNNYADDLAGGVCQDFAQYQKLCGMIQGLATAERYLLDLVEKVEKANDD
jgi:hypothetical protein